MTLYLRRLERRVTAILGEAPVGAVGAVRTTDAFAARFRAEADRSGLSLDLENKSAESLVRLCPTCGAQNGRLAEACFNCQTELDATKDEQRVTEAKRRAWLQVVLEGRAPEARYLRIFESPTVSRLPLLEVPVSRARFEPAPLTRAHDSRSVAERFLAFFVERA